MKHDKLIRLLACLDKKEFKRFSKYVEGTLGLDSIPGRLFLYLKRAYPGFDEKGVDKSMVLQKVLGLSFDAKSAKRLSNEAHKLNEALLNFLIQEKLAVDKIERDKLIIDIYRDRKLDELFYLKTASTKKQILKQPDSIWKLFDLLKLNHLEYYYAPLSKMTLENPFLTKALSYLNGFYYITKQKYLAERMNRANILNKEKPHLEREQGINKSHWPAEEADLLQKIYDGLLKLTTEPNEQTYQSLKEILVNNYDQLSIEDQQIFVTYLFNYASDLTKKDEQAGLKTVFELYKFALEKEMLIESGFFSDANFRNIVYTACGINQLDWAEQFILQYQTYLVGANKENLILLAKARIALGRNQPKQALDLIEEVNFKECSHTLLVKLLQVRCYYALQEDYHEVLSPFIHSFESFIKKHKVLGEKTIKAHLNFLEILKLLARPIRKPSPIELQEKLDDKDLVASKAWLQTEINKMRRGRPKPPSDTGF